MLFPLVLASLSYFSHGDTEEALRSALLDYYEPMGEMASMIADGVLRTPDAIRERIEGFTALGVDELYLDATVSDPGQVDLLAGVALADRRWPSPPLRAAHRTPSRTSEPPGRVWSASAHPASSSTST